MTRNRSLFCLYSGAVLLWTLPAVALGQSVLETATVKYETVKREYVSEALIEAVNQSTVSAQTSGRVQEILFDVNDFVEKGSVIVRLVDAEQRAGVEQAEAGLAEAEARERQARAEFDRVQQVFERGLVARTVLDAAQAELKSAEARVEGARAALERTAEQLAYTSVKAPYSGIVLGRHVQIGEAVQPGQSLLSGVSLEQLRIVTAVPQRLIEAVRRHRQIQVLIDPERRERIEGERLTIFPYADPQTGTFKVRARLPRGTEGLYPGMFVKAAFTVGETQQMLAPGEAIVRRGEVTGVYTVDDSGRIRLRQVRVGRATNGAIEVLAGLEEGERVALDPIRAGIELMKARQEPKQ